MQTIDFNQLLELLNSSPAQPERTDSPVDSRSEQALRQDLNDNRFVIHIAEAMMKAKGLTAVPSEVL